MTTPKLNPRTERVRADSIRPGHVVMESDGHPAVVVRIAQRRGTLTFWCRYVWQAATEPVWPMRALRPSEAVDLSKEK